MTEINLDDYVLESKEELGELADVIREKSGAEGPLSVEQMTEQAATLFPTSTLKAYFDGSLTEFVVPLSVTKIAQRKFAYCNNLKSIILHNGITSIESFVFQNCSALTELKLPTSIKSISYGLCQSCTNLKNVSIPNTVTKIDGQAFHTCKALTSIELPNSITSIGGSVFTACVKLETIYCEWALGDVAGEPWGAPDTTDRIYVGSTKGVTFALNNDGNSYTVTGFDMEQYSGEPIDLVIGPQYNGLPVTAIADCAFTRAGGGSPIVAKSISFPDTLKSIGSYAFSDQSIVSLTIPDSVTDIGYGAFASNKSLKTATLGAGCKNMPADVFFGCTGGDSEDDKGLTSITAHWADNVLTNAPWGAVNAEITYDATYGTYGLQYEYDAALDGYKVTGFQYDEDLSSTAVVIPSIHNGKYVTAIADMAFNNQGGGTNTMITSIVIPDSVTSIGYAAFEYQYTLTDVSLPSTLKSIGDYAFESCNMLQSIDIPENVESIGEYAFGSSGITSLVLERHEPMLIGENAFTWCLALTEVRFNYCVQNVTNSLFEGCTALTKVHVPWDEGSDLKYVQSYWGMPDGCTVHYSDI